MANISEHNVKEQLFQMPTSVSLREDRSRRSERFILEVVIVIIGLSA